MFLAIILSVIAGSFFNMLIYRLNNGVSLLNPARSICPKCRERLHWFELIPVFSFLFQRGKCNSCGAPIPQRYLFVELAFILTAVVLVGNYSPAQLWTPSGVGVWLQLVLFWFFWAIFFSDLEYQEIPYTFSIGFAVSVLLLGVQGSLANLIVWLTLFLFIKAVEKFYYKHPVFGGADFLLFFLLALHFNLYQFILLLYLSFFSGAIISLLLLALRKTSKETLIPFTPFILFAFAITEYWGGFFLKLYAG